MTRRSLAEEIATIAAIPSPTFAEQARQAWIAERLASARGDVRTDSVGNLVWQWGAGRPAVLVTAHTDTVFPATTPLAFKRDDRRLIGPGIGDNAAAIAVTIRVVEKLLRDGEVGSGAVAFTVGEEGLGNLRGARKACQDLAPQSVIAVEGHGLEKVIADALGSIRARVSITGAGGHAWNDRDHPSAIHALVDIAAQIARQGSEQAPVNIGMINGGMAVNAIASHAEMTVERRACDAADLAGFVAFLEALRCDPRLALTVDLLGERPAATLPRDSPLLLTVLSVREQLGLPHVIEAGSTDANAAMGLDIPGLCLGVSHGRAMHTVDESIDVDSLALGEKQLEYVLTELLAEDGLASDHRHRNDGEGSAA